MVNKLLDIDTEVLLAWGKMSNSRVGIRANVVLLMRDGYSTAEIAKQTGLSIRNVQRWIGRFTDQGPRGLVDSQRPGRPMSAKRRRAVLKQIAPELYQPSEDVSPALVVQPRRRTFSRDVIWRAARISGLTSSRSSTKDIPTYIDGEFSLLGLVGLMYLPGLTFAAVQEGQPWSPKLSLVGYWIRPAPETLQAFRQSGWGLEKPISLPLALKAARHQSLKRDTPRTAREIWERWIKGILESDPPVAKSVRLIIVGDVTNPLVFKTLQLLQPWSPRTRSDRKAGDLNTPATVDLLPLCNSVQAWPFKSSRLSSLRGLIQLMKPWPKSESESTLRPFAWFRNHDQLIEMRNIHTH
jgi:transposase